MAGSSVLEGASIGGDGSEEVFCYAVFEASTDGVEVFIDDLTSCGGCWVYEVDLAIVFVAYMVVYIDEEGWLLEGVEDASQAGIGGAIESEDSIKFLRVRRWFLNFLPFR